MRSPFQLASLVITTFWKAYSKYRVHIVVISILGFLRGVCDSIGITLIIPLFSLALNQESIPDNVFTQLLQSIFSLLHIPFDLTFLLFFVAVLFFCKFIIVSITYVITIHITTTYEQRTRERLYESFLMSDWTYLLKQKIGFFENVIMSDVRHSQILLQKVSSFITAVSSLCVYLFVALRISFFTTLITILFGALISVLFLPIIRKTRVYSKQNSDYNKKVANHINEHMVGMKVIKSFGVESALIRVASSYFSKLRFLLSRIFLFRNINTSLFELISVFFILGLFFFLHKTPDFYIAEFAVVMFLVQRIFQYITQLQNTVHVITEALPYTKYVVDYLQESSLRRESQKEESVFPAELFDKDILYTNVSFSYQKKGNNTVQDVSLNIPGGTMVGIIGPSGSGKTTIVDLLLRLFPTEQGSITIGGIPTSSIQLTQLRSMIGYVSQDVFLIHGSIRDNIQFYDTSISDDDILQAAKEANIYDFIISLPAGFDTAVGERGVRLSAGQRQRIAIARALARDPRILVFDEATSALDTESERVIQDFITTSRGKRTIILVAHRLPTVRDCDVVFVMEQGRIVEQGEPSALLQDKTSYFAKMYKMYID